MIYVIDAFNVLYKFTELEDFMYSGELAAARKGLCRILTSYAKLKKPAASVMHLFFDGKKNQGDETIQEELGSLHLYYGHDFSADHLIKEFIKRYPQTGNLMVVTSDKDIRFFAKKHKCQLSLSEDFAKLVEESLQKANTKEQPPEKPESLGEDEINFWKKMFRERKK